MSDTKFVFKFSFDESGDWKNRVFKNGYVNGENISAFNHINDDSTLDLMEYGEWLNIKVEKNFLEVKTDLLGFYRVFYYLDNEKLFVSNDFDSIVIVLKQHDIELTVNESLTKLMFSSKNTYFNYMLSGDTFCKEVHILEPGQSIIFDGEKALVESNNVYELAENKVKNQSYEELLSLGIEYFHRCIKKYIGEKRTINLYLSGGRDSRACLSLLLSILSPKQFYVSTARPQNGATDSKRRGLEKDFIIACSICEKIGIPFFLPEKEITFRLGYSANFYDLKTFINNNYFAINVNSKRVIDDFNSVEIRGGAGELIRGSEFLDGFKSKLSFDEVKVKEDIKTIYHLLVKNNEFLSEAEEKYFIEMNSSFPGNTLQEKFDYRYLNSRNNRHFGHHRKSYLEGKYTYFPLANPYFLAASRKLSQAERRSGRMVLDIIKNTYPNLLDFPFADQFDVNDAVTIPDLLNMEEAIKIFHKPENKNQVAIVSVPNRSGMNTDSIFEELVYMAKKVEHINRNNSLKGLFGFIRKDLEESKKFDSVLHNKLLSFLSIFEPNYSSFHVYDYFNQ